MTWASLAGVTHYLGEEGLAHVYPIEHDSSLATSLDHRHAHSPLCFELFT